ISFIHPPAAVGPAHLPTDPPVQNRRIKQNPAGNGRMVNGQSTLGHHLLQIPVAQRIPQIPAHAQNDHFAPKVSSSKQCRLALAHSLHPTRGRSISFATPPLLRPSAE